MKFRIYAGVGILMGLGVLGLQAQEPAKERTINGGVLNGKATSLPKPEYPSHLREQGKGGVVSVEVVIDESGLVVSAIGSPAIKVRAGAEGMMAEKEDIDPTLVEAAENAARQAQFAPTMLSGVPVRIMGTITYNFVPRGKAADDGSKAVSGGVLNGKAISLPLPKYPPAARAVKAEGAVNVMVKINEAGEVLEAQAVSGHPLLRAAAVNAALEAKFNSTLLDGQPVRVSGVLVYNFVAGDKNDQ
jgi:TonB family protein